MSDPPSASPSEAPADPAPESAAPPEPNSANSAATPPPEPSPPSKPADEEAELKMAAFEVEAEVALLMDANAATERSGVALTNWAKFARPAELVVLAVVMIMLLVAKGGNDWARVGAGTAGLSTARVSGSEAYAPLSSQCATADAATAACALASAGSWASGLSSLALLAGVLLGTATVLQLLHQRGLLGAVAAKLKDPQRFERGLRLAPVALWSVLLLLLFVALLVYAVLAPSDEHGSVHLGLSYGAARLALLLGAGGAALHLAFQHGVAEDEAIDALDTLAGQWKHLSRVQKACLAAMLGGAVCELLLWVHRDEWGWLLLLFGAHAVSRRSRGQLMAYQCAAALAACTDTLGLASATDGLLVALRWLTLLSKLASVALLAVYPDVFS